jgi:tRNA 2-thiouridine synthesizing protein A
MSFIDVDAKGLQCPAPLMKLSKAVKKEAQVGDRVRLESTDKACIPDVQAWCEKMGHAIVESSESEGVMTVIVEKIHD